MQRRQQIQDLALKFAKPDGTFDMPGYQSALAQFDPQAAMELHQNELQSKNAELQGQKTQRDLNTAQTREIDMGNNKVTQEQQSDGTWKTIATAGRFAPQQSAASAFAQKVALIKQYGGTDDDVKRALGIGGADTSSVPTIDSLSPSDKATVQSIVDGRYPVPTGKQAMDPNWQRLISVAQQVDPTLDAGTYKARAAARQNFTSGKIGEQIKSLNTLAHHLDEFGSTIDQLDNSNVKNVNRVSNFFSSELGGKGQANLSKFNIASGAVGDELAKTFAGGQSALGDREHNKAIFDANNGADALRAAHQEASRLVLGRLQALQDQADQALGYGSRSIQVIDPKAKKLFDKFSGEGGGSSPVSMPSGGKVDLNAKDPLGLGL
jgi:hypothetical protein